MNCEGGAEREKEKEREGSAHSNDRRGGRKQYESDIRLSVSISVPVRTISFDISLRNDVGFIYH